MRCFVHSRRPCEHNPHFAPYTGADSLAARTDSILRQLFTAGRALNARAIRLGESIQKQLKTWTLRKLERRGLILRQGRPGFYRYDLTSRGREMAAARQARLTDR